MKLLTDFILVTGIILALLSIISLIRRGEKETHQKILALIFLLFLFEFLFFYAVLHKVKWLFLFTFLIEDPIALFIGPLILMYIKSIYASRIFAIQRLWTHFIPGALYLFFISLPAFYYLLTDNIIFDYIILLDKNLYLLNILIISPLVYSIISLRLLHTYKQVANQNFSNLEEKDLKWIGRLLIGVLIVCVIDLSTSFYELVYGELEWDTGFLTVVALTALVAYLAFYGISQSEILVPEFLLQRMETKQVAPRNNTSEKPLANMDLAEIEIIRERLNEALEKQRIFLDSNLTLGKLSKSVGTTDKKLSNFLNQHLNSSFYDLINRYRVEEVKRLMNSNDFSNYTLLGLAYEAGFKSKTSFYRVFKRITGLSPAEYKKGSL